MAAISHLPVGLAGPGYPVGSWLHLMLTTGGTFKHHEQRGEDGEGVKILTT